MVVPVVPRLLGMDSTAAPEKKEEGQEEGQEEHEQVQEGQAVPVHPALR